LAQHELLIAQFYFKKREYWAAAARYHGLWQSYPGQAMNDEAMYMEATCYEKLGKNDLAKPVYQQAAEVFPESDYGRKSAERLKALGG
jgi:outer membrane protein assembly factor BamD